MPGGSFSLRQKHRGQLVFRPPHKGASFAAKGRPSPRRVPTLPEAESSIGSGWMDMPESQPLPEDHVEVFPRLKERDPYKRLGISQDASYEEVQEARNYLVEQYRAHEPSRESIELALDDILQEKIKNRQKFGFKPPQRGKRGEAQGDEERISLWQQVRRRFEPSVPLTTLVNDGSVFAALGAWAAWQASSSDPTLPLGAAICFCAWKLHDKRSKRDPDGPHWGGNPVWGALVSTILGLMMGGLLAYAAAMYAPLPPRVGSEAVGMLLIALMLGFTAIYLK